MNAINQNFSYFRHGCETAPAGKYEWSREIREIIGRHVDEIRREVMATGITPDNCDSIVACVPGKELRVGDTITVWWSPRRDTIVSLEPYRGVYENDICKNARIAGFAIGPGMTIFPDEAFDVIARAA